MLFLIAWRNLWRSPVRSALIIGSVVLGLWAGIFINSVYYGVGRSRMTMAIEQEISHIQIHHPTFGDDKDIAFSMDADSVRTILHSTPGIRDFALRTITGGMIANASGSRGVQINGVDPVAEDSTRALSGFLVEGSYLSSDARHRVLIGQRLANKMKLEVGQKVVLTFMDTSNTITAGAFRISGLYRSENGPLDELNVYLLKSELDGLLHTEGKCQEAAVLLENGDLVDTTVSVLRAQMPQLLVQGWREVSPETAMMLSSLDSFTGVFIMIILLALAFGVINTMLMAVLERSHELGMLMAVGMNRRRIFSMILLETLILTLVGLPLGLLAAYFTVHSLGSTGIDLSGVSGETLNSYGYSAIIYPYWSWEKIQQTIVLVIFVAMVSAIFPAVKALRLRPVEAIRQ